jgi:integrase
LPPGVYRRVRGGSVRYYDAQGRALGGDLKRATLTVAQRLQDPMQTVRGAWKHASAEYLKWLESTECDLASRTVVEYKRQLRLLDRVFGDTLLAEIKPGSIGAIKTKMAKRKTMFNRLRSLISSVWKYASEQGFTDAPNPTTNVETYSERRDKKRVTDEMVAAVASHGDQVLRDWIALELVAGQRVSDTLILTRSMIEVKPDGSRELRPPNSKTGEPIRIAVTGDLARVVDELLTRDRSVSCAYLIQHRGRRVTYTMIRNRWDDALRLAKAEWKAAGREMPHFKRKDLRSKSANDERTTARERLGHTDRRTTERHYLVEPDLAAPGVLPPGILVENSGGKARG